MSAFELEGDVKEHPTAASPGKDEQKQQAAAAQWQPAAAPMPPMASYHGSGIEPSFDAFVPSFPAATTHQLPASGAPAPAPASSPVDSTLPHFDSFTSSMAPAAQPYRTPFDSPDPPDAVPSSDLNAVTDSQPPSRDMRSKSLIVDPVAFDAGSIFHTHRSTSSSGQHPASHVPRSSKSKAKSKQPAQPPAPLDTADKDLLFEGIIPDIVAHQATLNRRASEPVQLLGSRRAAAAAAAARTGTEPQAAATTASASTTPRSASSRPAGVPRRLSIKTIALKTEDASNINLDPISMQSPVTPRRTCTSCSEPAFAANLCAAHLTQQVSSGGGATTPTSVIRRVHGLWGRSVSVQSDQVILEWRFWKKAEHYTIQLRDDPLTHERVVVVNGKINYRSHPSAGFWKLSMVLGRSKSSAFEVLIEATPRSGLRGTGSVQLYSGPYEFEIWIEGFPFVEAQNNFLSELGAAQQMAMTKDDALGGDGEEQGAGGAGAGGDASAAASSSSSSSAVRSIRALHYDALHYIQKHWVKSVQYEKTRLGYPKSVVSWRFTLSGTPHHIVLSHSEKSGKRTLTLDGQTILSHTPSWINGLLLQRSSSHRFVLEQVPMEVRIQKVEFHGTGASSSDRPHFMYDLLIDKVPFAKCRKTLPEYAGGITDVDRVLQEQQSKAERQRRREEAKKKDPRIELSPE